MAKCPKCSSRKGKRHCPALVAAICSVCCGEHRLRTIDCPPDCPHLEKEAYQGERRREQAIRAGERFLAFNSAISSSDRGDAFGFGLHVQGDIYLFMRGYGSLTNAQVASSVEDIVGRSSRIYVPSDAPLPLAEFLHEQLENAPRYRKFHYLIGDDRRGILRELVRRVRQLEGEGAHAYEALVASFYDHVDFGADMQYSDEELQALEWRDVSRGAGGYRESRGGLILPE